MQNVVVGERCNWKLDKHFLRIKSVEKNLRELLTIFYGGSLHFSYNIERWLAQEKLIFIADHWAWEIFKILKCWSRVEGKKSVVTSTDPSSCLASWWTDCCIRHCRMDFECRKSSRARRPRSAREKTSCPTSSRGACSLWKSNWIRLRLIFISEEHFNLKSYSKKRLTYFLLLKMFYLNLFEIEYCVYSKFFFKVKQTELLILRKWFLKEKFQNKNVLNYSLFKFFICF